MTRQDVHTKLYMDLLAALDWLRFEAKARAVPSPQLIIWCGIWSDNSREIELRLKASSALDRDGSVIRGKHLGEMFEEYCQRHGWQERQDRLQLTPPAIDLPSPVNGPTEHDDLPREGF